MGFDIDAIESALLKAQRIKEICKVIDADYFTFSADYHDNSVALEARMANLCINNNTYGTLLDIAHDYIIEIMECLNEVTAQYYENEQSKE